MLQLPLEGVKGNEWKYAVGPSPRMSEADSEPEESFISMTFWSYTSYGVRSSFIRSDFT